ncbi:MAG: hypothetical protein WAT17_02640, partial [Candidatus Saccharimonadales bacterium]
VPATIDSVSNQAQAYYDANGVGGFADDKAAGQVAALTDSPISALLGDATVWRRSSLANTGQNSIAIVLVGSTLCVIGVILATRRMVSRPGR